MTPRLHLVAPLLSVFILGCATVATPNTEAPQDDLSVAMAETLIKARAHSHAAPILQEALKRQPDDPRLHYLLGVVLRDRGIYNQAAKELQRALSLAPDLVPAVAAMGVLEDLRRNHKAALAWHRSAIAKAPGVARFHNNLGFSLYLAGKYPEAIAAYEHALSLDPSQTTIYNNLGFAFAATGRLDDAERAFRQSGGPAAALNNLAVALELRGEKRQARITYMQAIEADAGLKEAQENLNAITKESTP